MPRNKESFIGEREPAEQIPGLVSTKVKRKVDRKKGALQEHNRDEKALIALRKALASQSGLAKTNHERYYISGEDFYIASRGGGVQTKPGEPTTYTAKGRFKMGIVSQDNLRYRTAEFSVTYRDIKDERGQPDVDFIDPTTIDWLPSGASMTPASA